MNLDIPLGNCLTTGEDLQEKQFCKYCNTRMAYRNKVFLCLKCGHEVKEEEIKPQPRIVSVEEGTDVIAQPEPVGVNGSGDLPRGGRLIEERDL